MKNTTRLAHWLVLMAIGLSGLSCSTGGPEIGRVRGTVTLDGKAYPDAEVVFTPQGGRPSSGITDSAGQYELTYMREVKGATLGKHTVRITTIQKTSSDRDGGRPSKEAIPEKYNAQTTLFADVIQGDNTFDFSLTSK